MTCVNSSPIVLADLLNIVGLLCDGVLNARIGARIPLSQAGDALTLAESGTASGKVVLIP